MGKREQIKRVNREAILGAAKTVFAVKGLEATNVTEIIEKSGLAAGTFYKYFESKNAIFGALSEQIAEQIAVILEQAWKSEEDPEAYIRAITRLLSIFFEQDTAALGFVLRNYGALSDSFTDNNGWQRVANLLIVHMTTARDKGLLPDHDPKLMAKVLLASTSAVLAHIESDCPTLA